MHHEYINKVANNIGKNENGDIIIYCQQCNRNICERNLYQLEETMIYLKELLTSSMYRKKTVNTRERLARLEEAIVDTKRHQLMLNNKLSLFIEDMFYNYYYLCFKYYVFVIIHVQLAFSSVAASRRYITMKYIYMTIVIIYSYLNQCCSVLF